MKKTLPFFHLIHFLLLLLVPVEASQTSPLEVGDTIKGFRFNDIQGKKASTGDYPGWTVIYTFADRKNNKDLMAWMTDAGETVAQKNPKRRIVYINFADTKTVPRLFRYVAKSMLKNIDEKTVARIRESYQRAGIIDISEKLAFHVVPDWNGTYLETFGLSDASTYRIWIVLEERVHAVLDGSDPDVKQRFIRILDDL